MLETRFVTQLGRTVTRLGLGALPMGPLQRTLSVEEGARVVRAAVEGGITFIDTATLYGTYEPIARGLKGWRGPVTLATKTHAKADRGRRPPGHFPAAIQRSAYPPLRSFT